MSCEGKDTINVRTRDTEFEKEKIWENFVNWPTAKISWIQLAKVSGVLEKKCVQITEHCTIVWLLLDSKHNIL